MTSRKTARRQAMDYLAVRDHSRLELSRKLARKGYSDDDIETALDSVEASGFISSPEVQSQKVSDALHEKKKSHSYIREYLEAKGLPPVPRDSEKELEKAENLVKSRFSKLSKGAGTDKKKMARFLISRGFDTQTVERTVAAVLDDL